MIAPDGRLASYWIEREEPPMYPLPTAGQQLDDAGSTAPQNAPGVIFDRVLQSRDQVTQRVLCALVTVDLGWEPFPPQVLREVVGEVPEGGEFESEAERDDLADMVTARIQQYRGWRPGRTALDSVLTGGAW